MRTAFSVYKCTIIKTNKKEGLLTPIKHNHAFAWLLITMPLNGVLNEIKCTVKLYDKNCFLYTITYIQNIMMFTMWHSILTLCQIFL